MCFGSQYFRQVPRAAWHCGERRPKPGARPIRERRGKICGGCGKHLSGIGLRANNWRVRYYRVSNWWRRGCEARIEGVSEFMILRCYRLLTAKKVETRVL